MSSGKLIFFMGSYSECHKTLFFLTKNVLYLQVQYAKINNNNNNEDRSGEKPHFCCINVCRRRLLALHGGSERQQDASACGDAPHQDVATYPKPAGPAWLPAGSWGSLCKSQGLSPQLTHRMRATIYNGHMPQPRRMIKQLCPVLGSPL